MAGVPDLGGERATVEGIEPRAAPHQPGERKRGRQHGEAVLAGGARDGHEQPGRDRPRHDRDARQVRAGQPGAERREEHVRPGAGGNRAHGATRSRSVSSRAGPMPGIASRSSTDVKAPFFWR